MHLDNYDDYILNQLFENVKVNTLPFLITERLIEILEIIDHPIAKKLLELHEKREEKNMTFIDYDDNIFSPGVDNDTIFKRFTFLNSNKGYDNITKSRNINLDQIKSFMKSNELTSNNYNTEWFKKSRSAIKIGSFIKKIFGDTFKDAGDPGNDITTFVNMFASKRKSIELGYGGFELVSGEDIVHWYNEDNYTDGGTLGSSCMRYDRCSDYIEFYAKNKNVRLLILKDPLDDERIVGRAIVWKLHEPEDRFFMDRIYYTSDRYIEDFKDYATEQGWLYKNEQNMNEYTKIVDGLDGTLKPRTLVAECSSNSYYPYMDTMKFFSEDEGVITNNSEYLESSGEYYILTDTGGGYDTRNSGIYVEYYDDYFDEDDLQWCKYGDEYRLSEDAIELGKDFHYEYATKEYVEENLEWSDYSDKYIEKEYAIWSEYDRSFIHVDDSLEFIISADYETFDEAIEDDDNKEERADSNSYIAYYRDDNYYYFSKYENKEYFILVQTKTGEKYKHKEWDKSNFIEKNGVIYYFDDQKEMDKLTGQLRLFDKKYHNF